MVDPRATAVLDKPGTGDGRSNRFPRPTAVQRRWLRRGLAQPGGKLPLFDELGQRYSERTIRSCIEQGWAEPWTNNPIKPDWLVCRITAAGRTAASPPSSRAAEA